MPTWLHDGWIGTNRQRSAGDCVQVQCSHGYGMSRCVGCRRTRESERHKTAMGVSL